MSEGWAISKGNGIISKWKSLDLHVVLKKLLLHLSSIAAFSLASPKHHLNGPFQRHIYDTERHLSNKIKNTGSFLAFRLVWEILYLNIQPKFICLMYSEWINMRPRRRASGKVQWPTHQWHTHAALQMAQHRQLRWTANAGATVQQDNTKAVYCKEVGGHSLSGWGWHVFLCTIGLSMQRLSTPIKRFLIAWGPVHIQKSTERLYEHEATEFQKQRDSPRKCMCSMSHF